MCKLSLIEMNFIYSLKNKPNDAHSKNIFIILNFFNMRLGIQNYIDLVFVSLGDECTSILKAIFCLI